MGTHRAGIRSTPFASLTGRGLMTAATALALTAGPAAGLALAGEVQDRDPSTSHEDHGHEHEEHQHDEDHDEKHHGKDRKYHDKDREDDRDDDEEHDLLGSITGLLG